MLRPILESQHISHTGARQLIGAERLFEIYESNGDILELYSPQVYFPVSYDRGIDNLIMAFVAMWPILDASVALAEGQASPLSAHLDRFRDWCLEAASRENAADAAEIGALDKVELDVSPVTIGSLTLDSYRFIENRKWYGVLARDNWTCCSCGRTPREGITLEVDHIQPRSLGGTDDVANLQTLCRKCNSGKSNLDKTNLRFDTRS